MPKTVVIKTEVAIRTINRGGNKTVSKVVNRTDKADSKNDKTVSHCAKISEGNGIRKTEHGKPSAARGRNTPSTVVAVCLAFTKSHDTWLKTGVVDT